MNGFDPELWHRVKDGIIQEGDYYQAGIEEYPGEWRIVPPKWIGQSIVFEETPSIIRRIKNVK